MTQECTAMFLALVILSSLSVVTSSPQSPFQENGDPFQNGGQNNGLNRPIPQYDNPNQGHFPPTNSRPGALPGSNPSLPNVGQPSDRVQTPFDYTNRKPFDPNNPRPFDPNNPRPFDPNNPKPFDPNNPKPFDPSNPKPFDPSSPKPFDPNGLKPFDPNNPKPYDPNNPPFSPGQQDSKPLPGQFSNPSNQNYNNPSQGEFPSGTEAPGPFPNVFDPQNSFNNSGLGIPAEAFGNDFNQTIYNDTAQVNVTTPTTAQNSSESESGFSESLADFVIDNISGLIDPSRKKGTEENQEVEGDLKHGGMSEECRYEMDLTHVCPYITTETVTHFDGNLTLLNIMEDMFESSILKALMGCPRGKWCLDYYYHDAIKAAAWKFNDIYCLNVSEWSMRGCLDTLRMKYPECITQEVDFVYNSISLLCGMWDTAFMENECYTRTKKSLYILFDELLMQEQHKLDIDNCEPYTVELMKSYLCADDACHYDQQQMLLGFPPFNELNEYPDAKLMLCNVSSNVECQGQDYQGDYYYDYNEMYNDYGNEDTNVNYSDNMDQIIEKIMNTVTGSTPTYPSEGDGSRQVGELGGGDKALFVGLVAAVVILSVGFFLLLVLGFKRFRRGSHEGGYPVYTKLASEEEASGMRAAF